MIMLPYLQQASWPAGIRAMAAKLIVVALTVTFTNALCVDAAVLLGLEFTACSAGRPGNSKIIAATHSRAQRAQHAGGDQ